MIDSEKLKELAQQQKREYERRYREENRERLKEYQKQWRLNNPGKTEQYRDTYWEKKALAAIEEAKQRGEHDKI